MKSLFRIFAMATFGTSFPAIAFDLQGHRGARGLAPENAIEAFSTALSIGVTTLELDVGMTKDGVLVVHHDEWLNPDTTRGPDGAFLSRRGPAIYSLTLEEVNYTTLAASSPELPMLHGSLNSIRGMGPVSPRSGRCSNWSDGREQSISASISKRS